MNLKKQADMHQSANALRAAIYGAPLVPNASIDRHSPGGALNRERTIEYQRQHNESHTGLCPGSNATVRPDDPAFCLNLQRDLVFCADMKPRNKAIYEP
jgi:hypothetical protein